MCFVIVILINDQSVCVCVREREREREREAVKKCSFSFICEYFSNIGCLFTNIMPDQRCNENKITSTFPP